MARWLRALAPLGEDPGSIPRHPHGGLKPSVMPVLKDLTHFSGVGG